MPGILPVVMEAKARGITRCVVPEENVREGMLVPGMEVLGVKSLEETADIVNGRKKPRRRRYGRRAFPPGRLPADDFSEVRGQENVRRAAELAVAGGHNLLLIGSPGSGEDNDCQMHSGNPAAP